MNDNVIIKKGEDGTEVLQFKRLLEFPNVKHCYTLRTNNVNVQAREQVPNPLNQSYKKVANVLGIECKNIVKPHQTHTDRVEIVNDGDDTFDEVDGVITNKNGILLCTTSADCTSLLFYDNNKKVVADVHSGWRGTLKQIGKKAVEKMVQEFDCDSSDIICCISPCIRKCHFEVEQDVMELFKKEFRHLKEISEIIETGIKIDGVQKYNIDTTLINRLMLREAGLQEQNIIDCGICTVCNSNEFHSYRVDKEASGRNGAFIGLV